MTAQTLVADDLPAAGDDIGGYRIDRREDLPNLKGTYFELTHKATGARHIHIACPDDNHTFGVLFPTVPQDSTGVAHILEHVVLAGSKRFPVRDPFFSMLPRSLKTFMNALTSSDWTMYPFSTRNEKDFFNLLSIYLDATFFPLISEEAFRQEGHRFEFEVPDDPSSGLRYKGVVFNEMKGAMASPQSVMHRGIGKALFPGLTYANNSGGDPENIPDLTWDQLKQFHAVHYHPSNAYFFTYGDLPMERLLGEIDKQALSQFSRIDIDVSIPDIDRFSAPTRFTLAYPLDPTEDPLRKSQALVAWVTNNVSNSFENLVLKILEEFLLGNSGSPLRLALMNSGLGDALADGTGYHSDFREAVFGAGLKGIDEADAEKVEHLVLGTLQDLVENGLDAAQIDAAIHQLEFDAREISNQGFPYSLKLFFELSGAYMYGGNPYRSLQFEADLARLGEERRDDSFFPSALRKWFIDNPHRALVTLNPDQKLEEQRTQAEFDRLKGIEERLSDADKKRIVDDAMKLKRLQEAKQDLSSLPTLELSDVPLSFEPVAHSIANAGKSRVGFFPQPTNGISYVDFRGDFGHLEDSALDHLPLFAYVLTRSGAGSDGYVEMANRIASATGGISAGAGVRPHATDGRDQRFWTLGGKALTRNHNPFFSIATDFLTAPNFEPKRLHQLIAELKTQREASVVQAGTSYAQSLAAAQLSGTAALDERLGGLSQLANLKSLADLPEEALEELIGTLNGISKGLFHGDGLQICVTSEEKFQDSLLQLVGNTVSAMGTGTSSSTPSEHAPRPGRPQARTTSSPVAFNVKVFKTVTFTHPDAPALLALGNFMRATFLHREIREKGGAYGAAASFDAERGLFTLSSFRDPNIARTYQIFDQAVTEVLGGALEPDDIKEAVLSASGSIDPLESPNTKGRRRFFDDLAGYTLELRETFKRGLLAVTKQDLIRVAETYLSGGAPAMATISNAEAVGAANKEMGGIFEVTSI